MQEVRGFTLIEMLIVIAVIAGLAALVIPMLGGVSEDAAITTTLNEMKDIKEVIRDRFYPGIGLIPEDLGPDGIPDNLGPDGKPGTDDEIPDGRPEYATRYLCLKDDGTGPPTGPERQEMYDFLTDMEAAGILGSGQADRLIDWDRYSRKGWHSLYIEREVLTSDGKPLIIDAWGKKVESSVDPDEVIGEYRIFGGQDRNLAQIVSYGRLDANGDGNKADCSIVIGTDGNNYVCIQPHFSVAVNNRPITGTYWADYWALDNTQSGSAWATGIDYETFGGDDLVMFIFGTQPVRSP